MSSKQYFLPKHAVGQYHCPHCGVYAKQRWSHIQAAGDLYTAPYPNHHLSNIDGMTIVSGNLSEEWSMSFCEHCQGLVIWLRDTIIYPKKIIVEQPNGDLEKIFKTIIWKQLVFLVIRLGRRQLFYDWPCKSSASNWVETARILILTLVC